MAEHGNLEYESGVGGTVFNDSLQASEGAGSDLDADAFLEHGIGVEGGLAGEGEVDVSQFPVKLVLVGDADDLGDALGAVGLVGLVQRASQEHIAGVEGQLDRDFVLAVISDLADQGEEMGDAFGR